LITPGGGGQEGRLYDTHDQRGVPGGRFFLKKNKKRGPSEKKESSKWKHSKGDDGDCEEGAHPKIKLNLAQRGKTMRHGKLP